MNMLLGGRLALAGAVITVLLCGLATGASAYDDLYGPGFEIGVGGRYMSLQEGPGWLPDNYNMGFGSIAIRLYKGLCIEGGASFGRGSDPDDDWLDISANRRLWTQEHSNISDKFFGLRYEIPLYRLNWGPVGPDFFYIGAGLTQNKYKLDSSVIDDDGTPLLPGSKLYTVGKSKGQYYTFAGRWKVKTDQSVAGDSWFGSIGVDLGVRYSTYNDNDRQYSASTKFKSSFSTVEAFLLASMKLRFLY